MSLIIETKINRHADYSSIVEFYVTASKDIDDFGNVYDIVAELSGAFTHVPFMGSINDIPNYYFDDRSANAGQAHWLVAEEVNNIGNALGIEPSELTDFDTLVIFENVDVNKAYRGHRLALRLMREIAYIFTRSHALYVLKAHPTGEDIDVSDDDCRRLAEYYSSDEELGFKAVNPKEFPGWLVSSGSVGLEDSEDSRYFESHIPD